MPDITMCDGGACEAKHMCYRYTAKPNPMGQSFFIRPPFKMTESGTTQCMYLWPINQEKQDDENTDE